MIEFKTTGTIPVCTKINVDMSFKPYWHTTAVVHSESKFLSFYMRMGCPTIASLEAVILTPGYVGRTLDVITMAYDETGTGTPG